MSRHGVASVPLVCVRYLRGGGSRRLDPPYRTALGVKTHTIDTRQPDGPLPALPTGTYNQVSRNSRSRASPRRHGLAPNIEYNSPAPSGARPWHPADISLLANRSAWVTR